MRWLLSRFNVGRALLALLISLALYSVVAGEQNPSEVASFDLRAELDNQPSGLVVINDSSSRAVTARIQGPRDAMASLRPSSLRAYVDLAKSTPGADQYPVHIELPDPRLRVVDVTPSRLTVRLDQNVDRMVPVRLNRVGNVPFGYEAGDPEIDPTTVTVSGPASAVRNVDAMVIEFRLDGVTSTVDGRYAGTAVDASGQPVASDGPAIRVNPAQIRVRIPVEQQLSYKTVGVQPTISGSVQSGYVIEGVTTEPSAVTIVGAPQALASANYAQTEPIDATDASATFARQVSVIVPEGVSVVGEGEVRVTVRIAPLSLSQSVSAVPVPENVSSGLQVGSALPSVQIILQGPPSALRGIQPSDVRVTVNLAGRGAGTHQVAVDVAAPPGITAQSINPSVVSVTLTEIQNTDTVPTATSTPRPPTRVPPTRTPTIPPATLTEEPPTPRPTGTRSTTPVSTPITTPRTQ
jgi:YbbR domain-containing protein